MTGTSSTADRRAPDPGALRSRLRLLGTVLAAALFVGWWLVLAPGGLGGHTTYAEVVGHSMLPELHTGDVAVARAQPAYHLGELVIFAVHRGGHYGYVIHRLHSGSAATGWKTKGDHNSWVDPWTIPNSSVAGRFWFEIPQFGSVMTWVRADPLLFGAACTAVGMLFLLPRRRRHVAPALAAALETASKEPAREGRTTTEYGVLTVSAVAALLCAAVLARLTAGHDVVGVRGAVAAGALVWSGGWALLLVRRLFDGRGMEEPTRSAYALSGRLYRVGTLGPLDAGARPVGSALELRALAERARLPVLYEVDPATGHQEFLLVTDGDGSYRWDVGPPGPRSVPSIRVTRPRRRRYDVSPRESRPSGPLPVPSLPVPSSPLPVPDLHPSSQRSV